MSFITSTSGRKKSLLTGNNLEKELAHTLLWVTSRVKKKAKKGGGEWRRKRLTSYEQIIGTKQRYEGGFDSSDFNGAKGNIRL